MKKICLFYFLCLFLFSACTHLYKPGGPREATFFERSDRKISPQIAKSIPENQRQKKIVAWAGLIKRVDLTKIDDQQLRATFLVEHRNFDWVTDRGLQQQIYFLSKKGEGDFTAEVVFTRPDGMSFDDLKSGFTKQNEIGNMIVVYGTPWVDKGKLTLKDAMARPIPKNLFHTNWDY